jgi:hypothetical protein
MFAMMAGAVLALFFLGLPLAIIGMFIMSVLDQSSTWIGRSDRKLTNAREDVIVRYPERGSERATAKRREDMVAWRDPGLERKINARAGGR